MHVRGASFIDAVKQLTDDRSTNFSYQTVKHEPIKITERIPFELPSKNKDTSRVSRYLAGRGIDREIIDSCFNQKILYESAKYHSAVFIGRDTNNTARFACVRGTADNFKQDISGSDKRFNFCLPPADNKCKTLLAFESAIDALSFATIRKMNKGTWNDLHYLSLSGTSSLAAVQYLKDHPDIDRVCLCLDNDRAGRDGMAKITKAILSDSVLKKQISQVAIRPPKIGKDYNETLCTILKQRKETKEKSSVLEALKACAEKMCSQSMEKQTPLKACSIER